MHWKNRLQYTLFVILIIFLPFLLIAESFKAVRPDASTFLVDCNDCCVSNNTIDSYCDESISLLDIINTEIQELGSFQQECCFALFSAIESLNQGSCENPITSDLINNTPGGYVTGRNGIFCLVQDTVYSNGNAITINNPFNQVILDLGGYTLTLDIPPANGSAVVINGAGVGSVIIKNGAMSGGFGHVIVNDATFVIIQDLRMTFSDGSMPSIQLNNCNNVIIQNVEIRYAGGNGIEINHSTNCFIKDSSIQQSGASGIFISESSNCIFDNVTSFNNIGAGFLVEGVGFFNNSFDIVYRGCTAFENGNGGFIIQTDSASAIIQNVLYELCNAYNNTVSGFGLNGIGIKSKMISYVSYINCVSCGNNGIGYLTGDVVQDDSVTGIVYQNCQAIGNASTGFVFQNKGIEVDSCIAEQNQTGGFVIKGQTRLINCRSNDNFSGAGFAITGPNQFIQKCFAFNNVQDGFLINPAALNVQILNSYASNNGNIGINNNSLSSYIWGNSSINNGFANYGTGVNTPLFSTPAGSTYWENVN